MTGGRFLWAREPVNHGLHIMFIPCILWRMDTITPADNAAKKSMLLFSLAIFCTALASGFGSQIFSNYFNDVFHITPVQRGFLEVPRESPGVLCMVVVMLLSGLGTVRMAVLSQLLVFCGVLVMAFFSPSYSIMLLFLFVESLGEHFFMPLNDTLSMALTKKGSEGTGYGKYKGVSTTGSLAAAVCVFIGFKTGFFTFSSRIILTFVCSIVFSFASASFLFMLHRTLKNPPAVKRHTLVIRRAYLPYYLVALGYGCQKRIRIVFAPWVIIMLLKQGADTIALLTIAIRFIGSAMAPCIGKGLDKLGVKKMLVIESLYIFATFCAMGLLAGMLDSGRLSAGSSFASGISPAVLMLYAAYILVALFDQFNMVHSFLMRTIALDKAEVTNTLSVGISFDHIMAVVASPVLGCVWAALGVQYVFYFTALSAVFQTAAAFMAHSAEREVTV